MKLPSFLQKTIKKETSFDSSNTEGIQPKKYTISGTSRDYSLIKKEDIAIKIWLPEPAKICLNEKIP